MIYMEIYILIITDFWGGGKWFSPNGIIPGNAMGKRLEPFEKIKYFGPGSMGF